MPLDVPARVLRHEALNPEHFLITLEAPRLARVARPGQFVMLQVREGRDPLLRRPMSICRLPPGGRSVQILYKVVGEGTRYLSRQPAGARLMVLGPLGNGFALPQRAPRGGARRGAARRPILVAGGIGVAIFPFLAEALQRLGHRPLLLFGARTHRDLAGLHFFRARRVPQRLATEDGSVGARGLVTRLLEPLLAKVAGDAGVELYVCGPTPMMRAVSGLAVDAAVPCQLALESQMPCGIGVCLGCVVRCSPQTGEPVYRRVCTEGPIFPASEVAW
jgi:dihydroorotate dehydrogenase electron transfer subunit